MTNSLICFQSSKFFDLVTERIQSFFLKALFFWKNSFRHVKSSFDNPANKKLNFQLRFLAVRWLSACFVGKTCSKIELNLTKTSEIFTSWGVLIRMQVSKKTESYRSLMKRFNFIAKVFYLYFRLFLTFFRLTKLENRTISVNFETISVVF